MSGLRDRLTGRLAELDRRLVPSLARRLRTAVDGGARARRAVVATTTRTARQGASALGTGLDRLDARLASRGPLALLREVPQLALLLVAAVFVSGSLAAVRLTEPAPRSPGPAAGDRVLRTATLGVPPGTDVDEHLAGAREVVEALADRAPDTRYLALVSLTRHLPVADVPRLAEGVDVVRAYLRAPDVEGAETIEVPLSGVTLSAVLPALCTATSGRKASDAESLRTLAGTIEVVTTEEQLQKDDFLAEADRAAAEAAAFGDDCATVFALVVQGDGASLSGLLGRDGVRGVEAAPVGVELLDLEVLPLLPATTGPAPEPGP
ncbi:MAG TPA: hypothetical protein VNU66_03250 [Mycobacteriales bacterium]|nr:hypothetical protein [Mycobacteriales bacterium]